MNKLIDQLTDYYLKGTEGIKIIYWCIVSTTIYGVINIGLIKLFNFSLDTFFLLSAGSFFPYIWTLFTFPFIHTSFFDLLFTMIMLYFSERIFRIYFNGESFVKFFFLGNTVGGICFLLFSFITNQSYIFLGGSLLGVYSILFAVISYNPKMEMSLFPLPFKFPIYILGIILLAFDVIPIIGGDQLVSRFLSHLGAAAFGYLYMKSFQAGNDFLGKFVPDLNMIHKVASKLNFKSKKEERKNNTSSRPKTDEEFSKEKVEKQKQINKILDKISTSGYESLTKEEKDFLFNSSK